MAGSIPVALSQQFNANAQALAGCLLFIYAANTTTPQDSFQDVGLTIKNAWPLEADNNGRLPMFYLADGSVHVRLTDSAGVVQFDYASMLVIGPSSGGGGGGGGVDPTTIFQTGDVLWTDQAGTRSGWVRDNGRTIGNATSGASERANADTQALFIFLWNAYSNAVCPVLGGRGATGLADFNANKQITLPDKRGYSPIGDTAMGNADSVRLASVPFSQGNATTPGSQAGEALHTLSTPEIPNHTHVFVGVPLPPHTHTLPEDGSVGHTSSTGNNALGSVAGTTSMTTDAASAGTPSGTNNGTGGGLAHNITSLVVIGTFFRKL